jgi:hypothetical protein
MPFCRSSTSGCGPWTFGAHALPFEHSAPLTTCGVGLVGLSGERVAAWTSGRAVSGPERRVVVRAGSTWRCSRAPRGQTAARVSWVQIGRGACSSSNRGQRAHPVHNNLVSMRPHAGQLQCGSLPALIPSPARRGNCVTRPGQLQQLRQAHSSRSLPRQRR